MELLTFAFDDEDETLYHQLYSHIKREIETKRLKHNDKLPSKRKLANHLDISQNTVETAYGQLIQEGYITSIERKGYFVAEIDNLLILGESEETPIDRVREIDDSIQYDFSYHGVDRESFPFNIWAKITRDTINEYEEKLLESTEPEGSYDLRKSIASYLRQSRGVLCDPDNIILNSGTEYLFYILFQLFKKDNIYGIENPGYEKINSLFYNSKAKYLPIGIDEKGMVIKNIEDSGANIICITPAHQFPTGIIMPINRRIQLLNWMNDKDDRYIIEDDYDSEFKFSGRPIPALKGLKNSQKVIYMGSFSKSLAPGMRISYMVMPEELIWKFRNKLGFMTCPIPTMVQKVLAKFMDDGYFARHLNRMRNIYKKKRETLVNALSGHEDKFQIIGADAGLHVTIEVNNGMTEKELVESAESKGVRVYGLSKYYTKGSSNRCTILLGYANMSELEIQNGMEILLNAW